MYEKHVFGGHPLDHQRNFAKGLENGWKKRNWNSRTAKKTIFLFYKPLCRSAMVNSTWTCFTDRQKVIYRSTVQMMQNSSNIKPIAVFFCTIRLRFTDLWYCKSCIPITLQWTHNLASLIGWPKYITKFYQIFHRFLVPILQAFAEHILYCVYWTESRICINYIIIYRCVTI